MNQLKHKFSATVCLSVLSASVTVFSVMYVFAEAGFVPYGASTLERYRPVHAERTRLRRERSAYRKAMEDFESGDIEEKPDLRDTESYSSYRNDTSRVVNTALSIEDKVSALDGRQQSIVRRYATAVGRCPAYLKSKGLYLLCKELLEADDAEENRQTIMGLMNPQAYWFKQRDVEPVSLRARINQVRQANSVNVQRSIQRPSTRRYIEAQTHGAAEEK